MADSDRLRDLIERARHHKMTPEEKFEQRVSFVYGQQSHRGPQRTKDEIRRHLIEIHGYPAKPAEE